MRLGFVGSESDDSFLLCNLILFLFLIQKYAVYATHVSIIHTIPMGHMRRYSPTRLGESKSALE